MALLGTFSNPELEKRFQHQHSLQLARTDGQVVLTFACIFFAGCLLQRPFLSSAALPALVGGVLWLLPWLLQRSSRARYHAHRRTYVAALRLAALYLPGIASVPAQISLGARLQAANGGTFASMVALAAQVGRGWVMSLGLRTDLSTHLVLAALLAAHVAAGTAIACCSAPPLNNPVVQQRFWSLARTLTRSVGLLLPNFEWRPEHEAEPPGTHHCVAVLITAHLTLGFLLPAVAVYVLERRARARFLAAAAAELGLGAGPEELAEQVQLPVGEVIEVCSFDTHAAWLRALGLLPVVTGGTWVAVLMLVTQSPGA